MTSSPGSTTDWMIEKIIIFAPGVTSTFRGLTFTPWREFR